MQPKDAGYLHDMLEAAKALQAFTGNVTYEEFLADPMRQAAIERKIEIIGEAARRVSKEFRDANTQIPWRPIIAQRHIVAHEYDRLVHQRIFKVATIHAASLAAELHRLLPAPPPDPLPEPTLFDLENPIILLDKRITIAGLGRFGGNITAARWLVGQGAKVVVTDQATEKDLAGSIAQLEGLPVEYHLGAFNEADFTQTDLVVASPAIPLNNPFLVAAKNAGVPVSTEIRLFVERCPARIVGVTGTKGKSTTTALLGRMLAEKYKTWVGGNIGGSLLPNLHEIKPSDIVVLELSSYMLEHLKAMQWSPHVALVTMVAADHLAWHGSLEAYQDAKKNIVRFQKSADVAVLNSRDAGASSFAQGIASRVVPYPLVDAKPFDLTLPGSHNQLNAQGAFATANVLGVTWDEAQKAVRDFPGLPHRLQLVHESNGVRFYNDSIATIPEAAIAALDSFPSKRVLQIVGGYDSAAPLGPLCQALADRAKGVLCIGAIGPQIAQLLTTSSTPSNATVHDCGDLATAVTRAKSLANPGDIILLSTGCKSYDQFVNFEQRGDAFTSFAREE